MKRRIVPILCALFLSVTASNGAYAMTKSDLTNFLKEEAIVINGTERKLSQTQLQKAEQFLSKCGDLTSEQYGAISDAVDSVVALIKQKSTQDGMSLEQMNSDADVIANVTQIISNLKKEIPDLHIELESGNAFCGNIALGNAKLKVDLSDIKAADKASSNSNVEISTNTFDTTKKSNKSATSKSTPTTTSTSTPTSKSSQKTVKATGADIDLSVLSLTAAMSLFSIAAGVLAARKRKLFEGK